jgi:hypothetical protein
MATALKTRSQAAFGDAPGKTYSKSSAPATVRQAPEEIARHNRLQLLVQPTTMPMDTAITRFANTPTE